MLTPHKHAEIIKAWADGAKIEVLINEYSPSGDCGNSWKPAETPTWNIALQYRIKPEPRIVEGFISLPATSGHRNFLTNVSIYEKKYYKRCTITIHPDE